MKRRRRITWTYARQWHDIAQTNRDLGIAITLQQVVSWRNSHQNVLGKYWRGPRCLRDKVQP